MARKRRQHSYEFKFWAVLEAAKRVKTVDEIAVLLLLLIWRLNPVATEA